MHSLGVVLFTDTLIGLNERQLLPPTLLMGIERHTSLLRVVVQSLSLSLSLKLKKAYYIGFFIKTSSSKTRSPFVGPLSLYYGF